HAFLKARELENSIAHPASPEINTLSRGLRLPLEHLSLVVVWINQITKATPLGHLDYAAMQNAAASLQRTLAMMNRAVAECANFADLKLIAPKIIGFNVLPDVTSAFYDFENSNNADSTTTTDASTASQTTQQQNGLASQNNAPTIK